MFVYSVRASTVRFFTVIALVLVLLVIAVTFGSQSSVYASVSADGINFGGMKTNEDRVKFIEGFGIDVKDDPVSEESFRMPENFDRVIMGYNEIQKKQGLDISKYAKRKVTRYTYAVENSENLGAAYVNLLVYRSKIIACDVSSTEGDGFVLPLVEFDASSLARSEND